MPFILWKWNECGYQQLGQRSGLASAIYHSTPTTPLRAPHFLSRLYLDRMACEHPVKTEGIGITASGRLERDEASLPKLLCSGSADPFSHHICSQIYYKLTTNDLATLV